MKTDRSDVTEGSKGHCQEMLRSNAGGGAKKRLEQAKLIVNKLHNELMDTGNSVSDYMGDSIILPIIAKRMYEDRLARISVFEKSSLFGEPAWDLLLFIYVGMASFETITISVACNGAGCPPTTALRWLKTLEDANLIASRSDRMDNRKRCVSLTAKGIVKLESYLRLCAPHYNVT